MSNCLATQFYQFILLRKVSGDSSCPPFWSTLSFAKLVNFCLFSRYKIVSPSFNLYLSSYKRGLIFHILISLSAKFLFVFLFFLLGFFSFDYFFRSNFLYSKKSSVHYMHVKYLLLCGLSAYFLMVF